MKNPSTGRRGVDETGLRDCSEDTTAAPARAPDPGGLGRGSVMAVSLCLPSGLPITMRGVSLESRLQSECNPVKKI